MKLYLMQHGEAIVQYAVERAGVRVARIVHSGKLRARQTAEIWREHLPAALITEEEGLDPQASPEIWRERLALATRRLVGSVGPHARDRVTCRGCGT